MSTNSCSKSKRSFKSISSNPSSSTDVENSNKKGKTAQKTLGVTWGANSRSAFRNSPFSDFGSYMTVKNQKLHEQFNAAASSSSYSGSSYEKSIFSGVSIFVDGYTVPSSQELRGYMLKYGGRLENYFSRHRVTHIICSNLPDSKIKNLRAFSGGLPVVKPAWVLDSVAANKLLSWIPYQLDQLATENDKQAKLSAFFTPKNKGGPEVSFPLVNCQVISEHDNQSSVKTDPSLSDDHASLKQEEACILEHDDHFKIDICKGPPEEPACSVESSCEEEIKLSNCTSDGNDPDVKENLSTCPTSNSVCISSLDNFNSNEASSSRINATSNPHSTLSDPNFVENYFKSSRLHFIGTWRNRYRKRFPRLSNGMDKKSHLNNEPLNKSAIIHVDMDCFFVSVVIRNRPELMNRPVAVCHSDNPRGTSEISSANYPARDHGVKAGMFVKEAKLRCPQLVIVPYDFKAYEKVADQLYDILHKHCNNVQAVSCDEAFLDVSESELVDPQILASTIRKEIFDSTGCTASTGIAGNMLMARLATKTAKPDGQFYIPPEKVDDYLCNLSVKALPGIGHVLEAKLKQKRIQTCGELRLLTKESLQKEFGLKTGLMLWNYSRGIDNRLVGMIQECKSIGADVNWGVRFRSPDDTRHFLAKLCKEVALRLQGCGVQGRSFTLKIKKRRSDAGEPVKYMGCGDCENLSHTITVPMATDDVDVLQRLAAQLFGHFKIDVKDIRGVGLQASKLEAADDSKLVHKKNSILPWLASRSAKNRINQERGDLPSSRNDAGHANRLSDTRRPSGGRSSNQLCSNMPKSSAGASASLSSSEVTAPQVSSLPPLLDLDMSVIESLPPDVLSEMNEMYGGKLLDFISKKKHRTSGKDISYDALPRNSEVTRVEETEYQPAHLFESSTISVDNKCVEEMQRGEEAPSILSGDVSFATDRDVSFATDNLMPLSLSQVDCSVLQQLPDELRKDIIELLPQHRDPESFKDDSSIVIDKQTECETSELNDLWVGSPPKWVEKFKLSTCSLLNNFAEMYPSASTDSLSSLLQHLLSETFPPSDVGSVEFDISVSWMCDLFKQYVDLKIASDIEEIHFCVCLMQRLNGRSEFFLQVYGIILPHIQASMNEKYGGTLSIPFR